MDVIQLLPDSVANQIAAGEVIQRPASVIKELVENAIDAEAAEISVIVKDAGKSLIQIIDNGKGMSETDARMAFERHATSKIRSADDLFKLKTMGFRGEALASIAAIASVDLKTRARGEELGTHIHINGSEVLEQEAVSCPEGSNFAIKNLFFNVPARRKFLKTNATEFRHIMTEFQRIALVYPEIAFSLQHNETLVYKLKSGSFKQRISELFQKNLSKNLIAIKSESTVAEISGFISLPEFAKKTSNYQYFFVNGRFMKHYQYHKAILNSYEKLLPPKTQPSYFIYFEVEPDTIDVNIHPTKTEIKFENERVIFQILQSVVRESLGKHNVAPAIDFDNEGSIDIPYLNKDTDFKVPEVEINPAYNPFESDNSEKEKIQRNTYSSKNNFLEKANLDNWETLYKGFENRKDDFESLKADSDESIQQNILSSFDEDEVTDVSLERKLLQIKGKYILSSVKSGLMLIHQKRAHEKILYERILLQIEKKKGTSQRVMFPIQHTFSHDDFILFSEISDELKLMGFDFEIFGKDSIILNGFPAFLENKDGMTVFERLFFEYKNYDKNIGENLNEELAKSLARVSSMKVGKVLKQEEMRELIDQLFALPDPNFAPSGNKIIKMLSLEDIDKMF